MVSKLKGKSARVLIVESSSAGRTVIADVLRSLGFSEFQLADTVKGALDFLAVDAADWIIGPISSQEPVNLLHLLQIVSHHAKFKDVLVSATVDQGEEPAVVKAFELGLLSWHRRPFARDTLLAEFNVLFQQIERYSDKMAVVAFEQAQALLRERNLLKSHLSLVETCLERFPEELGLLLPLAESCFLNEQPERAKKVLGRAQSFGVEGWEAVVERYLGNGAPVTPCIGLSRVVVIDPDETIYRFVQTSLSKYSSTEIIWFGNGLEAATWFKRNRKVDLILQEWKIPKLTGPALVQRIRNLDLHSVPIVVVSSLVSKQDLPLLNEMSVANLIQKPLVEHEFLEAIVATLIQECKPSSPALLERRLHQLVNTGNTEHAKRILDAILQHPESAENLKRYALSLVLFKEGKYEEAKNVVVDAIQKNADHLKSFTLLGRCYVKLRDFQSAVKCFKKAQELSPKNIGRMCEMAEAHAQGGQPQEASEALGQAKAVDPESPLVAETEMKVALHTGNVEAAKGLEVELDSLLNVVSDMNNAAVAMIRTGKFDEGIGLYKRTLEALPNDKDEIRLKVIYNLVLAYARQQRLRESLDLAMSVKENSSLPIAKKLGMLRAHLHRAASQEKHVQFAHGEETFGGVAGLGEHAEPWADHSDGTAFETALNRPAKVDGPLPRCCFPWFKPADPKDANVEQLAENPPPFKLRKSIERERSMGLEKAMKAD